MPDSNSVCRRFRASWARCAGAPSSTPGGSPAPRARSVRRSSSRCVDTYESTLEDEKEIKRVSDFRTYIVNHWERIFDWRNIVEDVPKDARSLGCIESRQRHISFRMKRRGMHWSAKGAE